MELRHLRYFIAVAEEGSLLTAAQRRLNTSQPSLSRQIRDLESEIGVKLLERQARGVALTAAGRVFLDHARLALLQVEAADGRGPAGGTAGKACRSPSGFSQGRRSCGYPTRCALSARKRRRSKSHSVQSLLPRTLLVALMRGKLDVAFLRPETQTVGLSFKFLAKEPLIAVLPADHRLTSRKKIPAAGPRPRNLRQLGEDFSSIAIRDSKITRRKSGSPFKAEYEGDGLPSAMSLVRVHGRSHAYSALCRKIC